MKPFKLTPYFKEVIWGGDRLNQVYNKPIPSSQTGESWEISARPEGLSLVDGVPFDQFYQQHKTEILGQNAPEEFPLLFKLIDANDRLSVQVHPKDHDAKTEMWYILDAEPDAELIMGFKKDIPKAELKERAESGNLEAVMHTVKVKKGDAFFIPAGLVHAIGKGNLILEVQQSSDTTYRLYDYNRGREIHVEQALECADLTAFKPFVFPEGCLSKCAFFDVEKTVLPLTLKGFAAVFAQDGDIMLGDLVLQKGDFGIIPADCPEITLTGKGECVYVTL
ncbi:MAG: class I mannose-6-phosphate isomerase [Clostridia bacterium]|nr:class I mannose-6-phosphate isomerase [Clostridia bacterium]